MKSLLLIISLLFLTQNNLICNESLITNAKSQKNIPTHYIGVAASTISSIGISYHTVLFNSVEPRNFFKFTFAILPDLYDENVWIFFGVEHQYSFYMNDFSRLYGLIGGAYQSKDISLGLGMGYEIFSGNPGIAVNIDGGIALWQSIPNVHGTALGGGSEIVPGLGLGLSYAF